MSKNFASKEDAYAALFHSTYVPIVHQKLANAGIHIRTEEQLQQVLMIANELGQRTTKQAQASTDTLLQRGLEHLLPKTAAAHRNSELSQVVDALLSDPLVNQAAAALV